MALINCPECGKEISDKAVSCPNCGYPINPQPQQVEIVMPNKKSEDESQIIEIIQSEGKLSAVKWYKDKNNCGLREAHDYIDDIILKYNVIPAGGGSGCSIIVLIGISITLGAMFLL